MPEEKEPRYKTEYVFNGQVMDIEYSETMSQTPIYRDKIVTLCKQFKVPASQYKDVKAVVYDNGLQKQVITVYENPPERNAEFIAPAEKNQEEK